MSLGPADSEPGQGEQSADDVAAWLAPGDAQSDEHAGAECFSVTEPEDAKVLAGRVVRGEGEGDLEAGGAVPQLPVAWITTAVSISVAATHAGTPAVREINEQEARNATPERR